MHPSPDYPQTASLPVIRLHLVKPQELEHVSLPEHICIIHTHTHTSHTHHTCHTHMLTHTHHTHHTSHTHTQRMSHMHVTHTCTHMLTNITHTTHVTHARYTHITHTSSLKSCFSFSGRTNRVNGSPWKQVPWGGMVRLKWKASCIDHYSLIPQKLHKQGCCHGNLLPPL